jgi:hypothetical protein
MFVSVPTWTVTAAGSTDRCNTLLICSSDCVFQRDLTHAPPHNGAAQGLEVSLRYILQNLLLQRQLCHQPLQLGVFLVQFSQPLRLSELQTAIFLPPAALRLNGDFCFFAGLRGSLPVRNIHFNLPQQIHDLLRLVPLRGHGQPSSSFEIHSQFGWYKNPRSGQASVLKEMMPTVRIVLFTMYSEAVARAFPHEKLPADAVIDKGDGLGKLAEFVQALLH